jgi:hypothetical protein
MALKDAKRAEKPAFEQEPQGDTAVVDKAATETPKEPVADGKVDEAAAAATTSTAIAKAATTAVSTTEAAAKAKGFQKEVDAMKGAFDFSYGNFNVYKGNNGEIVQSGADGDSFGRWVKVRMLGWDEHFEVSPGEESAASKEFVAYSKDGKTIDSVIGEEQRGYVGKPVSEYVEYLRTTEEFDKADSRRFVDIACAVLGADNADAEDVGKVVQITLSQSSIPAFSKYQEGLKTTARCVEMGLPGFAVPEDPFQFFFIREPAAKGTKKWTKLRIEQNLPNKL